jgi:hypothetical protein
LPAPGETVLLAGRVRFAVLSQDFDKPIGKL